MTLLLLFVTIPALLLAAVTTGIAWRVTRENQRRSAARVTALAFELGDAAPAFPLQFQPEASDIVADETAGELFAIQPGETSGHRPLRIAVGGALVVAVAAVALVSAVGRTHRDPDGTTGAAASLSLLPLQLVDLSSSRGDHGLTITGTVRNPDAAATLTNVSALVQLVDGSGAVVARGTAVVDSGELPPGREETFSVNLTDAPAAARYRVSFRSGDQVVPHMDKRHGS